MEGRGQGGRREGGSIRAGAHLLRLHDAYLHLRPTQHCRGLMSCRLCRWPFFRSTPTPSQFATGAARCLAPRLLWTTAYALQTGINMHRLMSWSHRQPR